MVNLLSITCMTAAGLTVHFDGDRYTFLTQTGQPVGIAHKVNSKLYPLDAHTSINVGNNTGKANLTSRPTTASYKLRLWHQRMGHVHTRAITQLFSKNMVADNASTATIRNVVHSGASHDLHCMHARQASPHCNAISGYQQSNSPTPARTHGCLWTF